MTAELWPENELLKAFLDASLYRLWSMAHELDCGDIESAQETIDKIENEAWYLWELQNTYRDRCFNEARGLAALKEMQKWVEIQNGLENEPTSLSNPSNQ